MLRRPLLTLLAALATGQVQAQSTLRPDPTPRLPPQPGQGLPLEDLRFLRDAAALSRTQVEVAGRVAGKGGSEDISRFAGALVERHRALAQQIAALIQQHGGLEAAGPQPDADITQALRQLEATGSPGAAAEGERAFLTAELQVHPVLIRLYQAQASQSTDRGLARVAIVALVGIQEDFATATRLAAPLGLKPPDQTIANPPQYGGSGPSR